MRMYDIIAKKRNGNELSYEEINYFINGYCDGTIPDYQISALLMDIFLNGMNIREIADLTNIMLNSGEIIDLSEIDGIKVDKHSTGGVGDKTTLVIAPIVAACGVPVAKMSGRSLGHTGGTIDKLESIPGFKTSLSVREFINNVKDIGICITGQTGNLVPADKKLYALRDVTATVECIPLIASSIMSKKLATGADKIVLDVKTGSGALMKNLKDSIELANTLVEIGSMVGKKTVAFITDMDNPLGNAIGNSLEVIEGIETLKGNGPKDLEYVSFELAASMIELAGLGDINYCRAKVAEVVKNGAALNKLVQMIERQGGNPEVINKYNIFKEDNIKFEFISENEGYINNITTDLIGTISVILGAGRETKDSTIDNSAGIILHKKTGNKVTKGDLLATLYTNHSNKLNNALNVLENVFKFTDESPPKQSLILAHIEK